QGGRGAVLEVTSQESIDALIADIESKEGPISILCNNAGITRDTLLVRMKQEDWDSVIETNLASVFRLSKAVLRGMMKARKGRIISIASIVGLTGNPGQANYAAAKAGMIAFTKSLAREVGSRNITCNIIAPGFIDTDMTRALNEAQRAGLSSQIPLGRLGRPADIAAAAAFLASEEAGYVTGETLHVNGGMYMA
ncbi:MAG TPA: 3-oxoacyl-ACP reductase FabG, partial [Steroidobacteraceae bacterium]|nr:3-oxoacyl-ACP reductase FabG [Steroidobacteraceae bacterium]